MKRFSNTWLLHHLRNNPASLWLCSRRTLILMAATRESRVPPETSLPFKVDCWEDLECFEETERWHNKQAFLADAREQLNQGTHCLTLVDHGRLAFVDWMRPDTDRATFGHVGQTVLFPKHCSTQFSGYVHPAHRGQGLFHEGMRRIIDYLFEQTDTEFAMAAVESTNMTAFNGHVRVGFETIAMLETRCLAGKKTFTGQTESASFSLTPADDVSGTWRLERTP